MTHLQWNRVATGIGMIRKRRRATPGEIARHGVDETGADTTVPVGQQVSIIAIVASGLNGRAAQGHPFVLLYERLGSRGVAAGLRRHAATRRSPARFNRFPIIVRQCRRANHHELADAQVIEAARPWHGSSDAARSGVPYRSGCRLPAVRVSGRTTSTFRKAAVTMSGVRIADRCRSHRSRCHVGSACEISRQAFASQPSAAASRCGPTWSSTSA